MINYLINDDNDGYDGGLLHVITLHNFKLDAQLMKHRIDDIMGVQWQDWVSLCKNL